MDLLVFNSALHPIQDTLEIYNIFITNYFNIFQNGKNEKKFNFNSLSLGPTIQIFKTFRKTLKGGVFGEFI